MEDKNEMLRENKQQINLENMSLEMLIGFMQREKHFSDVSTEVQFLNLHGEVTEAYEEYRRMNKTELGKELADVAIYAYGLAERFDIDLDSAIRKKVMEVLQRDYTFIDGELYEVGKADTPVK